MKIKVLQQFRDKFDHKTMYEVGKEFDFDDNERVQDLIGRGLAELVEVKVEEVETTDEVEIVPEKTSGKGKKKK